MRHTTRNLRNRIRLQKIKKKLVREAEAGEKAAAKGLTAPRSREFGVEPLCKTSPPFTRW